MAAIEGMYAYRWRIAILLCLITTINYIDRQALTVAAPTLMEEFGISASEYGLITSGFLFAYGFGQLICGPLIDRLGTKRAFSAAVIAWSIAGMLHAFGRGFVSFFSFEKCGRPFASIWHLSKSMICRCGSSLIFCSSKGLSEDSCSLMTFKYSSCCEF